MLVAFYSPFNTSVDVNINGTLNTITIQKNIWTIVDKVVSRSQIINFKKTDKANIQILEDKWFGNKVPFQGDTFVSFISNGKASTRTYRSLRETLSDAILELDSSKTEKLATVAPATFYNILDTIGAKLIELQKTYENDKNADKLAAGIYELQVSYIAAIYDKFNTFIESNFNNDKYNEIYERVSGNKIDTFIKNDLVGVDFATNKIAIVNNEGLDVCAERLEEMTLKYNRNQAILDGLARGIINLERLTAAQEGLAECIKTFEKQLIEYTRSRESEKEDDYHSRYPEEK